jgi:hypothetical protein
MRTRLTARAERTARVLHGRTAVFANELVQRTYTTRACNLRVRQASIGLRSARNTLLGFEHAPQAQAEPGEMRRQQARVGWLDAPGRGKHL